MRIGIDYTSAIHQSAGIGRYTREMVRALAAGSGRDARLEFRLFVADAGKDFVQPLPGHNFVWRPAQISERWLARLWFRLRLPLPVEIWTGRLDLFHSPDFFLPPVMPSTRTIVTVHDLSFVREPASVMPGMTRQLNRWVPKSVERADHVIAVSEATRQDLIDLYRTPPEKISVLYHGVSRHFRPVADPACLQGVREKYRLGQKPFILSVGTIQPRKNYRRLVQALARLGADVSLVLAGGRGWGFDALQQEISRLGLAEQVRFPGYIDEEDLPALYSSAIVFVYPSLYEGFGLPVLEAMACGTPVIAADRSALPEVVGQAGLLVDPLAVEAMASAITRLLADEALRREYAAAGLRQAAKFSWPAMVGQLVDLYRRVILE